MALLENNQTKNIYLNVVTAFYFEFRKIPEHREFVDRWSDAGRFSPCLTIISYSTVNVVHASPKVQFFNVFLLSA